MTASTASTAPPQCFSWLKIVLRHLSLATLISLAVGAVVSGVLSAFAFGTALWIERRTETEQRTAVALIASEATRVIQSEFRQHGKLLAADSIQQLIHARWVRDPDIIRVSVQLPDQTIIADTNTRMVGTRANQNAIQDAASVVFREPHSTAARTFIFPVQSEDRQDLCRLVILVSTRAVMTDFYLLIESTLKMVTPVLLLLLVVIAGQGFWLSRIVLQRTPSSATPVCAENPHGEPSEGLTQDMSDVISRLKVAAHRLQDLAAR